MKGIILLYVDRIVVFRLKTFIYLYTTVHRSGLGGGTDACTKKLKPYLSTLHISGEICTDRDSQILNQYYIQTAEIK